MLFNANKNVTKPQLTKDCKNKLYLPDCGDVSVVGVVVGTGELGGVVGLLMEVVLDLFEEKRAKSPRLTGVVADTFSSFFSSSSITEKHVKPESKIFQFQFFFFNFTFFT